MLPNHPTRRLASRWVAILQASANLTLTLILLAACLPNTPTPTAPPPTSTTPADDHTQSLIPSQTGDIHLLDRPTTYVLTWQFDPAAPVLTGNQQVRYFNRQTAPLNEIYFRTFANYPDSGGRIVVSRVTVNGAVATPTFAAQNTALRVPLAAPLAPGALADLQLDYAVTVPRNNKQHYADFTADDNLVTLPTIFPLIPAYDATGWHIELGPPYGDLVYADTALFAATITAPSSYTLIASGSPIATQPNVNGMTTTRVIAAPMRDFDLNLTRGFAQERARVGETTLHAYSEPADAEAGKRVLEVAVNAFKTFEKRVGKYPYRELAIVETTTSAGGIEYPGVVVISRELYRDAKLRDDLEFTVAHEIAHQWFYGLVGNDQVNEPWVDEAFVQYLTYIYYEDVRGARIAQRVWQSAMQEPYLHAKQQGQDKPANLPVAAYGDENLYYSIIYAKAAHFFDAIRKQMGDAVFFQFLKTYFDRYRYKNVTGNELLKTAEQVYGKSLQSEYQQWILK